MISPTLMERPKESTRIAPYACVGCGARLVSTPEGWRCQRCKQTFPLIDGIADFRRGSDRYLSLEDERSKALRLARLGAETDLAGLAEAYYAMTPDPDPRRCRRFLAHILRASRRGEWFVADLPRGAVVLELGCGTGGALLAAARMGIEIVGADIASRWLVVARRRLDDAGVRVPLVAAQAERLPWPDASFDVVLADSVMEHVDDLESVLREAGRVLRPGGLLRVWSPNRFSVLADPHVRLWGVGWLPRRLAERYVRLRRGSVWLPNLLNARGFAQKARAAGFEVVHLGPPTIPSGQGGVAEAYRFATRSKMARVIAREFGPVWEVIARKPARGGS